MNDDLAVIIPAAGIGKRMRTVFPTTPKALLPVCGHPMIVYLLETLIRTRIAKRIVIVISPKHEAEFETALVSYDVEYAFQHEPLGSGDAVRCALSKIDPTCRDVLVLHCDQPLISTSTLRTVVDTHKSHRGPLTIVTATASDFEGWRLPLKDYGKIVRSADGRFERNVEVADATVRERDILEVNVGVYCFDRAWLSPRLEAVRPENAQGEYYLTDVLSEAAETLVTVPLEDIEEALGANTPAQLGTLDEIVRARLQTSHK